MRVQVLLIATLLFGCDDGGSRRDFDAMLEIAADGAISVDGVAITADPDSGKLFAQLRRLAGGRTEHLVRDPQFNVTVSATRVLVIVDPSTEFRHVAQLLGRCAIDGIKLWNVALECSHDSASRVEVPLSREFGTGCVVGRSEGPAYVRVHFESRRADEFDREQHSDDAWSIEELPPDVDSIDVSNVAWSDVERIVAERRPFGGSIAVTYVASSARPWSEIAPLVARAHALEPLHFEFWGD